MTPKQRIINALTGRETDRTPWSPFLAYWWEAHPHNGMDQLAFMESIGADPLLRGFGTPWSTHFSGVEMRSHSAGTSRYEEWETPVGTLRFRYQLSPEGNTWFLVDRPIRQAEDFRILAWIYEHASVEPNPSCDDYVRAVGERGLVAPLIGCESKTCFQAMVEKWVGIQNLSYFLCDVPDEVESCLASMRSLSDQTAAYCAESAAEAFIFWEDSSTTSISPTLFETYTAPEVSFWADALHQSGKLLIHHACGHLKALLRPMAKTGIDVIESITPPETGNVDIAEAFDLLPESVALIGGIEPVFFQNCTEEELDSRVRELLAVTKGKRFVLANSDSCPPGVEEWKLRHVSDLVKSAVL